MKNKGGRPSKIVKVDFRQVEELAGLGLTEKQIGMVLGVTAATVDNWKKHPEFLCALKTGKAKADSQVVRSLYERAKGYSHEEEVVFCHQGQIITHTVTKHYPPDPTSMIFWLKNRDKANWRDKVEVDHGLQDDMLEKYKEMKTDELIRTSKDIARTLLTSSGDSGGVIEAKAD